MKRHNLFFMNKQKKQAKILNLSEIFGNLQSGGFGRTEAEASADSKKKLRPKPKHRSYTIKNEKVEQLMNYFCLSPTDNPAHDCNFATGSIFGRRFFGR